MEKDTSKNSEKTGAIDDAELNRKQAVQYARELAVLYRSESEQRKQLEAANAELKKMNKELEELRSRLEMENAYLREEAKGELSPDQPIGSSAAIRKLLKQIEPVAQTDASVLLEGETGVGKELIARAIHEKSRRNCHPIVKVNCAAVPRELFESEFFGHLRGAFTGAIKDRVGRFQLADGGTLFLDEVGEIPLDQQSKLLRVLQEGQFERVGDDFTRKVDVRIIAATNRNLKEEIRRGRFREDLYYRLGVIPIYVPPLRERAEDFEALAVYFIDKICKRLGLKSAGLSRDNLDKMRQYAWPGNVRELQNVIERAVIISGGGPLQMDLMNSAAAPGDSGSPADRSKPVSGLFSEEELKDREKSNIEAALKQCNWKIYGPGGAAELLGIQPATLAYRIKKLGLGKRRRV